MFLRASAVYSLKLEGRALPALDSRVPVSLRWPDWYPPDALDAQRTAETLIALVKAGQLSRETACRILAPAYDIEDVNGELRRITTEETR
jgi:hypothetical protein